MLALPFFTLEGKSKCQRNALWPSFGFRLKLMAELNDYLELAIGSLEPGGTTST